MLVSTLFTVLAAAASVTAVPTHEKRAGAPVAVEYYSKQGKPLSPLHVGGSNHKKCLDIKEGIFQEGQALQVFDCNDSASQLIEFGHSWQGRTMAFTDFNGNGGWCAEAEKYVGARVHLTKCDSRKDTTVWHRENGNWKLHGTDLCLDVPDGNFENWNQLQVWTCDFNSVNQKFHPYYPNGDSDFPGQPNGGL